MPDDPTPHGGKALSTLPPDRARVTSGDDMTRADVRPSGADKTANDAGRPALPTQTGLAAADVEDEAADPVVDTGPGIDDDGADASLSGTRQPA